MRSDSLPLEVLPDNGIRLFIARADGPLAGSGEPHSLGLQLNRKALSIGASAV